MKTRKKKEKTENWKSITIDYCFMFYVAYFNPNYDLREKLQKQKAGWLAMHISDSVPLASGG